MGYALGTVDGAWDTIAQGASSLVSSAVSGATSGVQAPLVNAVRTVLPDLKNTLSEGLSAGLQDVARTNRAVLITTGVAFGIFTIGTLTMLILQYRRAGKCCPVGVR